MDNVDGSGGAHDGLDAQIARYDVEGVTADERRHAFEKMTYGEDATDPRGLLDPRIAEMLGRAVVDPEDERFLGELDVLESALQAEFAGHPFAVRVLGLATSEIVEASQTATTAARVALMRAVLAFFLNDRATWTALALREEQTP